MQRTQMLGGASARALETKDANGADLTDAVKRAVEPVMTAFDQFKATNEERLAQIEKKGAVDPVTEGKLQEIEKTLAGYEGLNQKLTLSEQQTKKAQEQFEELKTQLEAIQTSLRRGGQPISSPGIYSRVPMEIYHSADLCVGPSVSSSGLRTIFAESPLDFWIYSPLNPNRLEKPESEAFILGRAAHHLMLGEENFARYYVRRPAELNGKAWNSNRNDCKEWLELAAEAGQTVLKDAQIASCEGMAGVLPWQANLEDSGLKNNALVRAGAMAGLVEHTIIAQDRETGVWLKARPDVIPTGSREFMDFKTSADVSDEAIRRTLDDYRYDMQADLASACLEQAAGYRFEAFGFVFADKKPPHATNVIELDPADLEEAAKDNRAAIRTFARCLETGRWPGPAGQRGDAARVSRSAWNRTRAADRRAYLEQELAAA